MEFKEVLKGRRAVKHFDPDYKISAEVESELFDMAQQSPSSFNIQHWRFVNVKDIELRKKLREVAWDQAQVTDSSLLLVLCSDINAWKKNPERYWQNAPEDIANYLVNAIGDFYQGREWIQRDEAMRSCGLIGQTIMLSAKSLGLDSCPMIGFDQEKVAELINLPEDHAIGMMIAIGKGSKPARDKGGFLSREEIVIQNKF